MISWLWLLVPIWGLLIFTIIHISWVQRLTDWRQLYYMNEAINDTNEAIIKNLKAQLERIQKEKFEKAEKRNNDSIDAIEYDLGYPSTHPIHEYINSHHQARLNDYRYAETEKLEQELKDRKLKEKYPLSHDIKHSGHMTIKLFIDGKYHDEYARHYAVDYTKKYIKQDDCDNQGNTYFVKRKEQK